jgi:hypothetical protein
MIEACVRSISAGARGCEGGRRRFVSSCVAEAPASKRGSLVCVRSMAQAARTAFDPLAKDSPEVATVSPSSARRRRRYFSPTSGYTSYRHTAHLLPMSEGIGSLLTEKSAKGSSIGVVARRQLFLARSGPVIALFKRDDLDRGPEALTRHAELPGLIECSARTGGAAG